MKIKILFLVVGMIIMHYSHGQEYYCSKLPNWKKSEGYIVTNEFDTLHGSIKFTDKLKIQKEVVLEQNGEETIYSAEQLISYRIDSIYFVRVTFNGEPHLLQKLNDGYIKLYKYYHLKTTLIHAGIIIIPIVKLEEVYLVQRGFLPIEKVNRLKDFTVYCHDSKDMVNFILNKGYDKIILHTVLTKYNRWLSETRKINNRLRNDSINYLFGKSFEMAETDSILYFNPTVDSCMENYICRLECYYFNTPTVFLKILYNDRDGDKNLKKIGLLAYGGEEFHRWKRKIGTWRYYYPNYKDGKQLLKKEENFNSNGKLSGYVKQFDINGNLVLLEEYINGKKVGK